MQEFKIIGKIELPEKKIRPEEYREFLEHKLADNGREVNEELGEDFLDDKGTVLMSGGADLESDQKFVVDLENNWAREQHKTVEEWRYSKDKNPATITEMAVTASLHRLLKERFIVARASVYDDYRYGIDNVLIDKETGAVVCGLDEVLGHEGDDGAAKKEEKIKKILAKGGASLKYGATIKEGKLERQSLKNIPTFYLSLSKEELDNLLKDLKDNNEATDRERALAAKIILSLEQQAERNMAEVKNETLANNFESFKASLEVIKTKINKN